MHSVQFQPLTSKRENILAPGKYYLRKMIQICRKNKFGYCMFGDKCCFRHNIVKCVDKNCSVFKCEKRQPKICKYQRDFGRCKFTTYCSYNHDKQNDVSENGEKILAIEKRLENLITVIKNLVNSTKMLIRK